MGILQSHLCSQLPSPGYNSSPMLIKESVKVIYAQYLPFANTTDNSFYCL